MPFFLFFISFFIYNCNNKIKWVSEQHKQYNVEEYILLLHIHEQIYETDKILDFHMNYNHPRLQVKKKCSEINQIKDLKKSLLQYYLEQSKANPSLAKIFVPLYKLRWFLDCFNNCL